MTHFGPHMGDERELGKQTVITAPLIYCNNYILVIKKKRLRCIVGHSFLGFRLTTPWIFACASMCAWNGRVCSQTQRHWLVCCAAAIRAGHGSIVHHPTQPNNFQTQPMMLSQGRNPTHTPLHNNPCKVDIFLLNVANSKTQNRPRSYIGCNMTYTAYSYQTVTIVLHEVPSGSFLWLRP